MTKQYLLTTTSHMALHYHLEYNSKMMENIIHAVARQAVIDWLKND